MNIRQISGINDDINAISNVIENNQDILKNNIIALTNGLNPKPYNVIVNVTHSGSYITLEFNYNYNLVFTCHRTKYDQGRLIDNRIHCKVIIDGVQRGYSGVLLTDRHPSGFAFKQARNERWQLVYNNRDYFFCIFQAIGNLMQGRTGGKKNNIKINFNNYNISELKNICRTYKIKNYSKLNKAELISLIKKNKKLLK